MFWDVTVNPNKLDMDLAVIEEQIREEEPHVLYPPEQIGTPEETKARTDAAEKIQKDVEDALAGAGIAGAQVTACEVTGPKAMHLEVKGLGENALTFPITTYPTDPEGWAGDGTAEYINTVVLTEETTVHGLNLPDAEEADAPGEIKNRLLEKSPAGFDADQGTMKWRLVINESRLPLEEVHVTDRLSETEGFSYVEGSLQVESWTYEGEQKPELSGIVTDTDPQTGQPRLRFDVKGLKGTGQDPAAEEPYQGIRVSVTYEVKVDPDMQGFREDGSASCGNTAVMTSDKNPQEIEKTSEAGVEASPVKKTLSGDGDTSNKVSYQVEINPLGMHLTENGGETLTLSDTMDPGLKLDKSSVKLWTAKTVSAWNDKTKTYEVQIKPDQEVTPAPEVTCDVRDNSFSVRFQMPQGTERYALTYDAYAAASGVELSNRIELDGSILPSDADTVQSDAVFVFHALSGAGFAWPQGMAEIPVVKKDAADASAVLPGAVIGLYTSQDENALIAVSKTGADGKCRLVYDEAEVPADGVLYYKELQAPEGYLVNPDSPEDPGQGSGQDPDGTQEDPAKEPGKDGGAEAAPDTGDGMTVLPCAAGLAVSGSMFLHLLTGSRRRKNRF